MRDSVLDLTGDPFAFVLERGESFYATDFKRLLWSLPYYRGEVKVGSLLAVPVRTAGVVRGVLVADKLEVQAFTGDEPALLQAFAGLVAEAMASSGPRPAARTWATEFKAVYDVSRQIANLTDPVAIRVRLLSCARELVPLEGAAVVLADEAQTRYVVENARAGPTSSGPRGRHAGADLGGLAAQARRVEPASSTTCRAAGTACPSSSSTRAARARSRCWPCPAHAAEDARRAHPDRASAGPSTPPPSACSAIVANQAAAALHAGQMIEHARDVADHDGLTGLYNRRAFNDCLAPGGRAGGPPGRPLRAAAPGHRPLQEAQRHLRPSRGRRGPAPHRAAPRPTSSASRDLAARFGGEEFAVILASTDDGGAEHLAEKVRAEVERGRLVHDGARLGVTASIGVAVWPGDGREPAALVAAADRALYAAKEGGRNRVVSASAAPAVEVAIPEAPV